MTFPPEWRDALADPRRIAPYVGPKVQATNRDRTSGMLVPYIDARAVQDILDAVTGGAWSTKVEAGPEPVLDGGAVIAYAARASVTIGGVTREDAGFNAVAGGGSQAHDTALKGCVSDAIKRAAVQFGVGRALYGLPAPWVALNDRGYPANDQEVQGVVQQWRDILGGGAGQAQAPAAPPAPAPHAEAPAAAAPPAPPPVPGGQAYPQPPVGAPQAPPAASAAPPPSPAPPAAPNGAGSPPRATPGREPTEAQERAVAAILRRLGEGAPEVDWRQYADDFITSQGGRDRATVSSLIDRLGTEQRNRGIGRS